MNDAKALRAHRTFTSFQKPMFNASKAPLHMRREIINIFLHFTLLLFFLRCETGKTFPIFFVFLPCLSYGCDMALYLFVYLHSFINQKIPQRDTSLCLLLFLCERTFHLIYIPSIFSHFHACPIRMAGMTEGLSICLLNFLCAALNELLRELFGLCEAKWIIKRYKNVNTKRSLLQCLEPLDATSYTTQKNSLQFNFLIFLPQPGNPKRTKFWKEINAGKGILWT